MDKDGRKPKNFISTFHLTLKPRARTQDGQENNQLGVSIVTDSKLRALQPKEKPCFKQPLVDCTTREGSNAAFQGVITGSQPLSVSWQHNGKRVPAISTSFKNGVASLALSQCSPRDAGTYTCTAENAAGKHSSSAVLHVTGTPTDFPRSSNNNPHSDAKVKVPSADSTKFFSASTEKSRDREEDEVSTNTSPHTKVSTSTGPPVEFLDPPEQVEVRVGEKAQLHCDFESASVPVACCWIYNKDKVVVESPRMSVRTSERQSTLSVSQACPNDKGSYTVIVRNRKGSAQHTVSLNVIDRPNPPASQPVVSQLTTQSLVLCWTGPNYDGGTAVLGYIVEVRPEGHGGTWTEVANRCKSTSYHIRSGLEPLGRYHFRVRAYNSAGASEPSQESECVKMDTAKAEKKEPRPSYRPLVIDTEHNVEEHYNVHESLGVGKFGTVFRMSHKETGEVCAGKFYRARTSKERTAARKEVEIMKCLKHPKLVQCFAAYDTRSKMVTVLEYIAGGELFARIVDDSFEYTEPTSARYMQQILEGMRYVHKQNIIHLDLKPENIVCVDTTGTQIKIIDFGLSAKLEDDVPLMVMHGTPEFVAPEVISFEAVGLETDMWSIGVICFILLSGESPFQGNSDAETLARVTAAKYEFDEESFEDISDQAKDFISSLLKKDRRCRLSCAEALCHPWMVSFTPLSRRPTKSLRKSKMKQFLAKRKWKKTGKAVLALYRLANLTNRPDSPGSSTEEPCWSPEAEGAIQALDKQLHSAPCFQRALGDTTQPRGATARLTCLINGYPQPDVKWLHNERPVSEGSRVSVEHHEDGHCALLLADLKPADSGLYVCQASNKVGQARCSAKLKVEL